MSICRIICSNCGSDFVYKLYSPGNGVYCNDCYNLLAFYSLQKYEIKSYLPISKKKKTIRRFYNCEVIDE